MEGRPNEKHRDSHLFIGENPVTVPSFPGDAHAAPPASGLNRSASVASSTDPPALI